MEAVTRSDVDLKKSVIRLKKEKTLVMKMDKELLSCSSQMTMIGGQLADKLFKTI